MEKEESLRDHIKERVLELKDVDLGIFDAYNELPQDFRDQLSFDEYYRVHRQIIEEEKGDVEEDMSETLFAEMNDPEIQAKIQQQDEEDRKRMKENLCKRCGQEPRKFDDRDYCVKCISELVDEGQKTTERIKEELSQDSKFKELSSQDKAKAYVKKKYAEEQKKNKFVYLSTIAKESYALNKM